MSFERGIYRSLASIANQKAMTNSDIFAASLRSMKYARTSDLTIGILYVNPHLGGVHAIDVDQPRAFEGDVGIHRSSFSDARLPGTVVAEGEYAA